MHSPSYNLILRNNCMKHYLEVSRSGPESCAYESEEAVVALWRLVPFDSSAPVHDVPNALLAFLFGLDICVTAGFQFFAVV